MLGSAGLVLLVVVGLAGEDLVAAVELFEQHHACELMGQRQRAKRETVIDVVELEAERAADDEAHVATGLAPILEEAAESDRVQLLAFTGQERDKRALWNASGESLLLAHLDHLDTRVAAQQLEVVLDVIAVRRPQPPDRQDDDPHRCDTSSTMAEDEGVDRHINIHFAPEDMAGHYANFANVSFSDYEFTITFARVDHEVAEDEIPGVVVTRVNMAPKFARELADALEDSWSKYRTREGIKNLPEFGVEEDEDEFGER